MKGWGPGTQLLQYDSLAGGRIKCWRAGSYSRLWWPCSLYGGGCICTQPGMPGLLSTNSSWSCNGHTYGRQAKAISCWTACNVQAMCKQCASDVQVMCKCIQGMCNASNDTMADGLQIRHMLTNLTSGHICQSILDGHERTCRLAPHTAHALCLLRSQLDHGDFSDYALP